MNTSPETGIILLAAGSSSRMGRSKQLLPVDNNEPLLVKSAKTAIAAHVGAVVVVLGAGEKEHRAAIEHLPVQIVCNERWQTGMGSSLKEGLLFLSNGHPSLEGVIILVCDQPHLDASHIRKLLSRHAKTGKSIIASRYAGTEGVPAYFAKPVFEQLLAMDDSEGAKKIINKNRSDVASVDFLLGEVDLDTPEDYDIFRDQNPVT